MPRAVKCAAVLALVFTVFLRLVALESDAYPPLTYSSALLTDEGFYIHNARNLVLFGTERTDEFNNALLMPTLHAVQVAVFRLFGVGAVQARLISVVASLLTLLIFFAALRRPFGLRVACFGVLFLGLDHVSLLYSRMALMDTPAALLLVAAFWAFTKSKNHGGHGETRGRDNRTTENTERHGEEREGIRSDATSSALFLWLCGFLLGVGYATRSLVMFLFPVPMLALWGTKNRRAIAAIYGGLAGCLVIYAVCWYLPNRAEVTRIGQYYLFHQLLPQSVLELGQNIGRTFFDVERGMLPYLLLHTPVQFLLAVGFALKWGKYENIASARYLCWWLLIPLVLFCFVSYAPSRYYVLFMPAMAGLAALGIDRLWMQSEEREKQPRSNGSDTPDVRPKDAWRAAPPRHVIYCVALWAIINFAWLGDWLTHLRYTQHDTDRWLAQTLPPGSVLIGDAAPGVCLNNSFRAIPVIIGLCNDAQPIETFAPAPRYVIILNGKNYRNWWNQRYPHVFSPENQIRFWSRLVNFEVVMYRVPSMSSPDS